jgi:tetratricopeptide (TPR) repeat protein
LTAALLPAGLSGEEPDEISLGAARLLKFDSVTVVYPAEPDEDLETNRISAERRARFLTESRGIAADIVADDAITPAQLAGDLLLLGWGNRLLRTETAPDVITRDHSGWKLLDEIEGSLEEDLLFSARSPHGSGAYVVFWSRIDLESDRLLVLPFLGSDFAIYRDYLLVNQGMFADANTWPPVRNKKAERDIRPTLINAPVGRSSRHYDLHYLPIELTDDEAKLILATREAAFGQAVASTGNPPDDFRIQLFVYPSLEQKQSKTGSPDPAHVIGRRNELHMTMAQARSPNCHEDAHLVARSLLGPGYVSALFEGLAVVAEQPRDGDELGVTAALLVNNDALPTIEALLDEESMRRLTRRRIGFPAAGLLVRWLRENGDPATFKKVYGMKEGSLNELARALGKSAVVAENGFRVWVQRQAQIAQSTLAFRNAWGEARRLRDEGDFAGSAAALRGALEVKPDRPETLFALALVEIEAGELEAAELTLGRLLAQELEGEFARLESLAHFQLGRTLDLQGRRAEARQEFEKVLELPDRAGIHDRARAALAHDEQTP